MVTKKSKNRKKGGGRVPPPPVPPPELDVKLPGERPTIRDIVDPGRHRKLPRPDIEEWYKAYNEQEERQQRPKITVPAKSSMPSILSPEGIVIMFFAIFLDFLGLIGFIPLVGQILSYIPDILGIIVIGTWAWFRFGKIPFGKKMARFLKRPALIMVGELIPFVGILPLWSLYVFLKLKKG